MIPLPLTQSRSALPVIRGAFPAGHQEDSPGSGRAAGSSVSSVVCQKVPLFHLPHLWALTTQIGAAAFQRLTFSGH